MRVCVNLFIYMYSLVFIFFPPKRHHLTGVLLRTLHLHTLVVSLILALIPFAVGIILGHCRSRLLYQGYTRPRKQILQQE